MWETVFPGFAGAGGWAGDLGTCWVTAGGMQDCAINTVSLYGACSLLQGVMVKA